MSIYDLRRYCKRVACFSGCVLLLHPTAGAQTAIQFASGLGTPNAGAVLAGYSTYWFPPGLSAIKRIHSSPQGTCIGPKPGSAGAINCGVASLAVGQTMVVTVNVSLPVQGTFTVTGAATFNGSDTNAANNSFPVTIQVK